MDVIDELYLRQLEAGVEQVVRLSERQSLRIRTLLKEREALTARVAELEDAVHVLEKKLSIASIVSSDPGSRAPLRELQQRVGVMTRTVEECIDFLKKEI